MLYPLAVYYALVSLMYLGFGALYGAKNQWAIGTGKELFPVMHSKDRTIVSMALQLIGIGAAASVLASTLWLHLWIGAVACLAISLYEVYLSWTFYRGTAGGRWQLARLTFNSASAAWIVAWLTVGMGAV
jgi:hypothetical protein